MTAVRSGVGPDVAVLDRFTIAQRAASGRLSHLTPLMQKEGKDLSPIPKCPGKRFSTKTSFMRGALFYNKQILKEAADPGRSAILGQAEGSEEAVITNSQSQKGHSKWWTTPCSRKWIAFANEKLARNITSQAL